MRAVAAVGERPLERERLIARPRPAVEHGTGARWLEADLVVAIERLVGPQNHTGRSRPGRDRDRHLDRARGGHLGHLEVREAVRSLGGPRLAIDRPVADPRRTAHRERLAEASDDTGRRLDDEPAFRSRDLVDHQVATPFPRLVVLLARARGEPAEQVSPVPIRRRLRRIEGAGVERIIAGSQPRT